MERRDAGRPNGVEDRPSGLWPSAVAMTRAHACDPIEGGSPDFADPPSGRGMASIELWEATSEPCWIFLNSVDKAKRSNFTLLDVLDVADAIEGYSARVHIVLSGGVSDWEFKLDLKMIVSRSFEPGGFYTLSPAVPSPSPHRFGGSQRIGIPSLPCGADCSCRARRTTPSSQPICPNCSCIRAMTS